jgi:chromosome segregation ATPase
VAGPPDVSELEAELRELKAQVARLERELATASRELTRMRQSNSWRVTEPLRAAKAKLGGRR